jgi:8-oxo-dGTP pyrophosphatase MutT (NUDIX family)
MTDYIPWLRAKIGHRKVLIPYVTTVIRNSRGQLLCQQRGDFKRWGLPGGVLELGETLSQCAQREAAEETGLQVQSTRLIGVYASPDYDIVYPNGDQVQQITIALECTPVGGALQADGIESLGVQFFDPTALPDSLAIWYQHMVRDVIAQHPNPYFEAPLSRTPAIAGWQELRAWLGSTERILSIGTAALIQDSSGKILLTQRGDSGLWGLPAGLMELGETPSGTICREAQEELGITIRPTRLLGAFTGLHYWLTHPDGNQVQLVALVFAAQWVAGTLTPDGDEALAADFFSPTALPPLEARHLRVLESCLANPNQAIFE